MKLKIENGALVITTGIKAEDIAAKGGRIDLKDRKGNDVYTISTDLGGTASMGSKFFTANAIDAEGCVTFVKPLSAEISIAEVKKQYKDALISASLYIPNLAGQIASQNKYYDEVFADLTSDGIDAAVPVGEGTADPGEAAVDQLTE